MACEDENKKNDALSDFWYNQSNKTERSKRVEQR